MVLKAWRGRIFKFIRNFPIHIVIAILVAINGYIFLLPVWDLSPSHDLFQYLVMRDGASIADYLQSGGAGHLTRIMLGLYVLLMAIGLFARSRIAWVISLILLIAIAIFYIWLNLSNKSILIFTLFLIALLIVTWSKFNRASLAAGGLFVLLGISFLIIYAVLGTLYLGTEFAPSIEDPLDALYFSIVSMSTVGYGDIVPKSDNARLFTVSIIILGITIFATSVSTLIGPLISGNINRLMHGRINHVMRKNHIILVGSNPLVVSLYQALSKRGLDATIILGTNAINNFPKDADIVNGDASETDTLLESGAAHAKFIIPLGQDDAENAFVLLAARECMGSNTKLVALVNTPAHLNKLKSVNPDILISLQSLGSEIIARTINGESIDDNLITSLMFGKDKT